MVDRIYMKITLLPRNLYLAKTKPVNELTKSISPTAETVTIVLFRRALASDGRMKEKALTKLSH